MVVFKRSNKADTLLGNALALHDELHVNNEIFMGTVYGARACARACCSNNFVWLSFNDHTDTDRCWDLLAGSLKTFATTSNNTSVL